MVSQLFCWFAGLWFCWFVDHYHRYPPPCRQTRSWSPLPVPETLEEAPKQLLRVHVEGFSLVFHGIAALLVCWLVGFVGNMDLYYRDHHCHFQQHLLIVIRHRACRLDFDNLRKLG